MTTAYDIVVIGGGIHGVGVAQAAAAGGHRVLVLEAERLAAGTSSRSSKLIHGGLRYLEHAAFGLVRECLNEREILLRVAPDLVHLETMYIPTYRATRRRPWQIRTGLTLYALLGGLRASARFDTLKRDAWSTLDGLVTDDLQTVFRYAEAQTDDALLTAAVMRSAQKLGAELIAPARFVRATLGDPSTVEYVSDGQDRVCTARVIVNAAGPWVNEVAAAITPAPPLRSVALVQGTHILVPGRVERGIYYVESPRDGRAVFVMPWGDETLVGTTETPYAGDPAGVAPLPEEESYLLDVLHHYFPHYESRAAAIRSSFAGLRVLPTGSKTASRRSRETMLVGDQPTGPRVLTIYGGKLTAYRATAARVMSRIASSLPTRAAVADTRTLPLTAS